MTKPVNSLDKIKTLDEKIKALELEKQKLAEKHFQELSKKVATYLLKNVPFDHPHRNDITSHNFVIGALSYAVNEVKNDPKKISEITKNGEESLATKKKKRVKAKVKA